jgi:xanthine dehydrogenase small subunit
MTTAVFEINGQTVSVNDVDPHCTLLQWLRSSGLTGAKEGCAEGECGACAVAFLSRDAMGRACYESVNSCLVPLPEVHGRSLISVEGVQGGSADLHPVQQAMVDLGGSQCGYCTPGFVVSLFCEYYRPGRMAYEPEAISGNLCRCTGYRPIIEAASGLGAPAPDDVWLTRLAAPAPALPALRHDGTGAARFLRPDSLPALWAVLAENPDAVLLGGGTDLLVQVNQRHERHPNWVSLSAIPELQAFDWGESEIVLGAGLPLSQLEQRMPSVERAAELRSLGELLPLFSSRLIRNRATLGGNLATASPIGDAAPVLLTLGAELRLASARGERRVPLDAFFLGYRKTALLPGELIVSVHVPRPPGRMQRFYKISKRVLDDISTVSGAFALDLDAEGRVERLRVAYGGIAATPLRAQRLEQLALGKAWSPDTLGELLDAAGSLGTPMSDQRGSARYRQAMIQTSLQRFYAETSASMPAAVSTGAGGA